MYTIPLDKDTFLKVNELKSVCSLFSTLTLLHKGHMIFRNLRNEHRSISMTVENSPLGVRADPDAQLNLSLNLKPSNQKSLG